MPTNCVASAFSSSAALAAELHITRSRMGRGCVERRNMGLAQLNPRVLKPYIDSHLLCWGLLFIVCNVVNIKLATYVEDVNGVR